MRYKNIAAAIVAGVALSASAGVTITNVKATPRWPWNGKVDIDYTLTTDKEDETFYVYPVGMDGDRKLSITPITLEGDGAKGQKVGAGTHRMTWDATADDPTFNSSSFTMKIYAFSDAAPYMVVNMSGGTSVDKFETSYLPDVPEGGWTDEYKTTKLVLKLILPGSFLMGSPENCPNRSSNEKLHRVTLTKPYYVGVFETTRKQWELIMGENPADQNWGTGDSVAVYNISYDSIRGNTIGSEWPSSSQVNADSFLGVLRAKSGMAFDLPTEAQWEYMARAGRSGDYGIPESGSYDLHEYARYGSRSSDPGFYVGDVGSCKPNCWAIYGTIGNVAEWCLDWYRSNLGAADAIDPKGPEAPEAYTSSEIYRLIRDLTSYACSGDASRERLLRNPARQVGRPWERTPVWNAGGVGFRLVRNLSE